jgi:hypothetical protein
MTVIKTPRPMLVLDDHESGWSLYESPLDMAGPVVLCDPWIGFNRDKLALAQSLFRTQGSA